MQTPFFTPPVSQLAKTPFPTSKPANGGALSVGRQQKKNPCTPAHAGEVFNLNGLKAGNKNRFKLHKTAESDFMQSVPLLFGHLENTQVVFHNPGYVTVVFEHYHRRHALMFLDWVKALALMRSSCRTRLLDGVVESSEEDFLTALRLFRLREIKPKKRKTLPQRQKVWQAIVRHFPDTAFGSRDIEDKTLVPVANVNLHLRHFKAQGKLKTCRKVSRCKQYRLIKK